MCGKIKIKIVGRWTNLPMTDEDIWVYDIYYGFTGIPTTFPFCTKWKIDKAGLDRDEVIAYITKIVNSYSEFIIKF